MMNAFDSYKIQYPDRTNQAFGEVKSQILDTPFSLNQLQSLRDTIEQKLKEERDECQLFMVGDRTRENVRGQFGVLRQVLELNSIGVIRLRSARDSSDNGELGWTIIHRGWLVSAILVLRATDDTWEIRPIEHSNRKRRIVTVNENQDTIALNNTSLTALLKKEGVDLAGLGGWKLAS